jgi:hypothetical protein
MSVGPSVFLYVGLSACISADPTGRIVVKYGTGDILRQLVAEFQVRLQVDKIIGHFT